MPVHWFYSNEEIDKAFPTGINGFETPPAYHPTTVMGRPLPAETLVGSYILKGKKEYYGKENTHYHVGMPAGENTLNAYCARTLLQTYAQEKGYARDSFLIEYIKLVVEDTHPDAYAESYHHTFFRNLRDGQRPFECGVQTPSTASAGGLITVGPLAVLELLRNKSV
jgi:ADP-ribosylglycohydrolase